MALLQRVIVMVSNLRTLQALSLRPVKNHDG